MIFEIKLTQNQNTIVDKETYEWASQFKWYAARIGKRFYAARRKGKKIVTLHSEILKASNGMFIDHANNDSLDNRLSNLRLCNNQQNQANAILSKVNTSGYKGVSWHIREKKWIARIRYNKKLVHLGYFTDIVEAAKAYDNAAIFYNKEFAKGNGL